MVHAEPGVGWLMAIMDYAKLSCMMGMTIAPRIPFRDDTLLQA